MSCLREFVRLIRSQGVAPDVSKPDRIIAVLQHLQQLGWMRRAESLESH